MNLTDKQERFAVEYILNGRDTIAAYKEVYDVGKDTKKVSVYRQAWAVKNNV